MTDRTRRTLAARYANGGMTASEREALEKLMGSDERLRLFIESERIIGTAFQRSAATPAWGAAVEHAATRATVMEQLAHTGHIAQQTTGISLAAKIIAMSVLGLGAAAGGYVALQDSGEEQRPAPAQVNASAPVPQEMQPSVDTAAQSASPTGYTADTTRPAEVVEKQGTRPAAARPSGTVRQPEQPATAQPASPSVVNTHQQAPATTPATPPVIRRTQPRVTQDSAVHLKITVPKKSEGPK